MNIPSPGITAASRIALLGVAILCSVCVAAAATDENKRAAAGLVAEAAVLLDQGDGQQLQQAEAKLRQALAINPDEPAAYVELARYSMKAAGLNPTSLTRAEGLIRRAIAIAPDFGNAYVLLGYVLTHANRLKEAEAAFAAAKEHRATSPWLEFNIAEMRDRQGERQLAAESFIRIAALPTNPTGLRSSALNWLQKYYVGEKQFEQADLAYREQIDLEPNHPWPKGNYSVFLRIYRMDLDQSERYAREALALMNYRMARQSLATTLYLKWAEALVVQNDAKRGEQLFAEAQQFHPDPAIVLEEVGLYAKPHPIVTALASKGISVSTMPGIVGGTTPLAVAAATSNHALAAQLVLAAADPNVAVYQGVTPLIIAAKSGDEAMVQLLLSAGADPTLLSQEGKDAEQYAWDNNRSSAAQLLASAKQTYVRPANAQVLSDPFRVRHVYRVKKDWIKTPGTKDWYHDFLAGEEVTFVRPLSYGGDSTRIGFLFKGADGKPRELSMATKDTGLCSEYFEEIGVVAH